MGSQSHVRLRERGQRTRPGRTASSTSWCIFRADPQQRKELETWLHGWSLALAETNHLKTGIRTDGLLDVRFTGGDSPATGAPSP